MEEARVWQGAMGIVYLGQDWAGREAISVLRIERGASRVVIKGIRGTWSELGLGIVTQHTVETVIRHTCDKA